MQNCKQPHWLEEDRCQAKYRRLVRSKFVLEGKSWCLAHRANIPSPFLERKESWELLDAPHLRTAGLLKYSCLLPEARYHAALLCLRDRASLNINCRWLHLNCNLVMHALRQQTRCAYPSIVDAKPVVWLNPDEQNNRLSLSCGAIGPPPRTILQLHYA